MKNAKRLSTAAAAAVTLWAQAAFADSTPAQINDNREYSIVWSLGDWSATALVDTGATYSLLPPGQISQLMSEGKARLYGSIGAHTGSGSTVMAVYVVQEFTVGTCSIKGPFLVLEAPVTAFGANMLYAIRPWRFDGDSLYFTCPR